MEEAVVVEVHTRVNYDLFCDYQRFVSSGGKKYYKKYPFRQVAIDGAICLGAIIVILLIRRFAIETHRTYDIWFFMPFTAFWAGTTIRVIYDYYIAPKVSYTKQRKQLEKETVFRFGQNRLIVKDKMDDSPDKSVWSYDFMNRVYELNNVFYLEFEDNESYILDKKQMAPDDAEAVSKLLQEKFGKRYTRIEAD